MWPSLCPSWRRLRSAWMFQKKFVKRVRETLERSWNQSQRSGVTFHQKSLAFFDCYCYISIICFNILYLCTWLYLNIIEDWRYKTFLLGKTRIFIYPVMLIEWLFTRSRHQIKYFESRLELLFKQMGIIIIIEGAEVGIRTGSASPNVSFIGNLTQCLGLSE